jgi:apolipoprotein N-acyltransferase
MKWITHQKPITLALLSGVLMALSFPEIGSLNLVMGLAFVPLLLLEDKLKDTKRAGAKIFGLSYLSFLIYNVLTTYWIYFADPVASFLAFLANALLMAITFWFFYFTKKHVGKKQGYIALVFFWLTFEYWHYHWELSHPWLTLGNVFANAPMLVQWYEWTGALGGSLWLLIINLLLFFALQFFSQENNAKQRKFVLGFIAVWMLVPISYSLFRYYTYQEQGSQIEVVVAQPNVDSYTEKFGPNMLNAAQQMDSIIVPVSKVITPKTQFVIAPETAIPFEFDEASFEAGHPYYDYLEQARNEWQVPNFLIGASSYAVFGKKKSSSSRKLQDGCYYESYNTSVFWSSDAKPKFIHKSKLVLGVERIPFMKYLPFMENFAMDMGGASGTLGVEEKAMNYKTKDLTFTSLVCYESIYGAWVADFVREGSQVIFIITNDGWWRDTPGYRQHFAFARLRAVETRRSIARSANTGSSGFINQRGEVVQRSKYGVQLAMRGRVALNSTLTPYVVHGDLIGRVSQLASVLIVILALVRFFRQFGSITPYGGKK